LCRYAGALVEFQKVVGAESFLDAFLETRSDPAAFAAVEFDRELDVANLEGDPKGGHLVHNLAFASWKPEMFPTLSDLQDERRPGRFRRGLTRSCARL
jgi:hypothetical protein